MRTATLAMLSLVLLTSCASIHRQDGLGEAPRSEIAVIELVSCGDNCPVLQEVDDKWVGIGVFKEHEIKPGMRSIQFLYSAKGLQSSKALTVSFNAEKGEVYGVRQVTVLNYWKPQIIKNSTGEVVGTVTGSSHAY